MGYWVRTEAEGQIHLTQLLLPRYAPATSAAHPASHILHPAFPLHSSQDLQITGKLLTSLTIPVAVGPGSRVTATMPALGLATCQQALELPLEMPWLPSRRARQAHRKKSSYHKKKSTENMETS